MLWNASDWFLLQTQSTDYRFEISHNFFIKIPFLDNSEAQP
ncbi:hypothetical protein D1AOALGA4SA_9525 [Olavius algarvensis Delta 1 endosymbiont]|nr:hypothetical protein D1AOALGA4SA_9525 [Olavius algarvensis Delta 1 endosymbiont]